VNKALFEIEDSQIVITDSTGKKTKIPIDHIVTFKPTQLKDGELGLDVSWKKKLK
jgi:uncharacterized protein YpmS